MLGNMVNIVHIGDIVGSPGRKAFARVVTQFKQKGKADLVAHTPSRL